MSKWNTRAHLTADERKIVAQYKEAMKDVVAAKKRAGEAARELDV
jgi:hypothetical protein